MLRCMRAPKGTVGRSLPPPAPHLCHARSSPQCMVAVMPSTLHHMPSRFVLVTFANTRESDYL